MNILHITAHLGGGAGLAISSMALHCQRSFGWTSRVALLEKPEKSRYVDACEQGGIRVACPDRKQLSDMMARSDAIILNWWHHPSMAPLLADFPNVPTRLLLWSHINGCAYPLLPAPFAEEVSSLLLTTPYSLENPSWEPSEREAVRKKSQIVYGLGEYASSIPHRKEHSRGKPFTIGYAGTLNDAKIHPRFADYCAAARDACPDIRFVLLGDPDEQLTARMAAHGLLSCTELAGHVDDVAARLLSFDVFGYLLNPDHFGTTENAILEAMAAALPVVALGHGPEKAIVRHNETGLLIHTPQEYAQSIRRLYDDASLRASLGSAARAHVLSSYSQDDNALRFRDAVERAAQSPKQIHSFPFVGDTPADCFLSFVGEERTLFARCMEENVSAEDLSALAHCRPIFRQTSKSSIYHFSRHHPGDARLRRLAARLRESDGGAQ